MLYFSIFLTRSSSCLYCDNEVKWHINFILIFVLLLTFVIIISVGWSQMCITRNQFGNILFLECFKTSSHFILLIKSYSNQHVLMPKGDSGVNFSTFSFTIMPLNYLQFLIIFFQSVMKMEWGLGEWEGGKKGKVGEREMLSMQDITLWVSFIAQLRELSSYGL